MQILRMEKHVLKLLVAGLHHLVHFVRVCIGFARHYADAAARSPLVLQVAAWMARTVKRPWFRKSRNALYHCAALIVGSTYEDEYVAFTARKLVKNDAYRDRLLVPEIEDLVTLCDALRLTLPQRKAYFQCFLHVDFMRRSSVSRAELLRYCNLRGTPLTGFLLPNAKAATHRETVGNRWDVIQLMVACFSICTADIVEVVQLAVAEALCPQDAEADESDNEIPATEQVEKEEMIEQEDSKIVESDRQPNRGETPSICQQIDQCLAFFVGVPDSFERSLQTLLVTLYDDNRAGDQHESSETKTSRISFQEIHGASTIFDVVRLFPVLIFPCIWTLRVLRTRVLGVKTWQYLQQRRIQLQPYLPTSTLFLSIADIIAASQVQLQDKRNQEDTILTSTGPQEDLDSAPSAALFNYGESARSDSASSRKSTPRKVIPCSASELATSDGETPSYVLEDPSRLRLAFDQCSTLAEAWRVTANHALASVYIQCLLEDASAIGEEELEAEFERVTKQIFAGKLSIERSERIRQRLVKEFGYRFTHTLLAKSSVKEMNHESKTPLDERRTEQRYAKAWRGSGLTEDKALYWKEFEDPAAKRPFYYNVRTGESRWEKPANFVGKTKARRRRKPKNTKSQEQPA
ncbi:hypothetical protein PRNP1_000198 [Phytophthora ramorum]